MRSPVLRLVCSDDFAAIAAITNHYIRETAIHFSYEPTTADALREQWRDQANVYPWLVTEVDGAVAGFAKAGTFRARTAYQWTAETGIYLTPDQRSRGLGAPLYSRLLAVLRTQGFHSAIGGIALPNEASVRLHERLGFAHCGTIASAGRKFDRWHDVGFWQLALQRQDHVPRNLGDPSVGFAATQGN